MERDTFGSLLWESSLKSWGGIITFLSLPLAVIPYFVISDEYQIKFKFIILIFIIFCFLLTIALRATWITYQRLNESLTSYKNLNDSYQTSKMSLTSCQELNKSLTEDQKLNLKIPKVKYVRSPPKLYSNAHALFLVNPTILLSYDAIVSIYYLEDDIERLVGVGKVINVQENKMIQIIITHDYDFEDKLNRLMNNSKDELDKLILKTSIPNSILQDITG